MKDLLKVVGKIAPTLASVFISPVAGLAVEALGQALGINEPTQEKIETALKGPLTGDQIVAIKAAEQALQVRLKELDIKVEELVVQDRISARTLFDKGAKLIGTIAVVTIVGFFAMIWAVLTGKLKGYQPEELIIVGTVIGYMAANTQQVYNYFFGSSSGSDKKNEGLMGAITKLGNGNGNGH